MKNEFGPNNNAMNISDNAGTAVSAESRVSESKAIAKIQAAMVMAKRFPRNENEAYMSIIESCKRNSLADQAVYAYPRGGKMVTGPSIRLAEVLAQKYGNIHIEIKIVNQTDKETEAVASAIDMQSNYIVEQGFVVPHKRTTKRGVTILTDERDIREMIQNIGSRILRGCILRVIPGDITESAMSQCQKTQESSDIPLKERTRAMITKFDELGVKVEHLEARLGHNLNATIAPEIVTLTGIYKSIKDGMASREDFFDIKGSNKTPEKTDLQSLLDDESKPKVDKSTGEIVDQPSSDDVFKIDVKKLSLLITTKDIPSDVVQGWMDKGNASSISELKHSTIKALIKKWDESTGE